MGVFSRNSQKIYLFFFPLRTRVFRGANCYEDMSCYWQLATGLLMLIVVAGSGSYVVNSSYDQWEVSQVHAGERVRSRELKLVKNSRKEEEK